MCGGGEPLPKNAVSIVSVSVSVVVVPLLLIAGAGAFAMWRSRDIYASVSLHGLFTFAEAIPSNPGQKADDGYRVAAATSAEYAAGLGPQTTTVSLVVPTDGKRIVDVRFRRAPLWGLCATFVCACNVCPSGRCNGWLAFSS